MHSISVRWIGLLFPCIAGLLVTPDPAVAQPIGTFRWQLAPYCNTLTLLVEQKGSLYELSGIDDQCGAPVAAAARGTAHFNPDGTVGLGITVIRPDGFTVASTASLSLATLSGTWKDEYSNSGTFQYSPPIPAPGTPRPITLKGEYSVVFTAAAAGALGSSALSFGRALPSAPDAAAANIVPAGGPPTATCPGTAASPQASPGFLCLYERSHVNVDLMGIGNDNAPVPAADPFGAFVYTTATAAGTVIAVGTWAVTVP